MAIKLSEVAEGSILLLNENGSPVEFYVAKHDYEAGLNGSGRTLVVRKDCYDARAWHSSNVNAFTTSAILGWLESTYTAMLDANVRTMIGSTKVYYTPGGGNTTVTSGEFTVFLLSVAEVGLTFGYSNTEGSALPIASTLQLVTLNGASVGQWLRTPRTDGTAYVCFVRSGDASVGYDSCTKTYGSRPAFTLPATAEVAETDDGYTFAVTVNAPAALGTKRTPFSFVYSVTDPSGGTLDIVESIGGVTIGTKTGIASGAEVECAVDQTVFDSLTDAAEHTITITATSSGGLTATAEVVFRKQVALLSFEQYISENAALRQTLADTLTEKGVEASGKEGYASLVPKVGTIEAGVKLPTLSNPASPSEILSGYEAIGQDGSVIEGEALATASTATAADIMSGKTAYDNSGNLLTGKALATATTATAANILSGKTAYNSAGNLLTGTLSKGYSVKNSTLNYMDANSASNTVTVSGTIYLALVSSASNFSIDGADYGKLLVAVTAGNKVTFEDNSNGYAQVSGGTLTVHGSTAVPATLYVRVFYS